MDHKTPIKYRKLAPKTEDVVLTFMIINKPVARNGTTGYQGDVAPTIYEMFGINYTSITPMFDKAVPIWERGINKVILSAIR